MDSQYLANKLKNLGKKLETSKDLHQLSSDYSNPLAKKLSNLKKPIENYKPLVEGRLLRMVGLTLEAVGCNLPVGSYCFVEGIYGKVEAEVVGFSGDKIFLMPLGQADGLQPGAKVIPNDRALKIPVGYGLLGRVLDGYARPIDGKGKLETTQEADLQPKPINPLARKPIDKPLDVGIRAINSLFTVGQGQRLGLFAGSGVGKSVLLGMMTKFTAADVIVVGLVGERGREVKEFIEQILGEEGMQKAVVIASPADDVPLMRIRAAQLTHTIAEFYRDEGKNVLLLMDSLTRYAQAQRELALAIGEPPATKGYPPSVFALMPKLVERAGNGSGNQGSITAFYTVLTEGDDQQDPIADAARAILDGHIVLSRRLAEEGHYPAIDVEASISRAMTQIVPLEYLQKVYRFKHIYSTYQENRDLINLGAYTKGSDAQIDMSIKMLEPMRNFLRQGLEEKVDFINGVESLELLIRATEQEHDFRYQ